MSARQGRVTQPNSWTAEQDNLTRVMRDAGATHEQIALAIGRSVGAVRQRLSVELNDRGIDRSRIPVDPKRVWMVEGCRPGQWPETLSAIRIAAAIARNELRVTASVPMRRLPPPTHVITASTEGRA